MSAFGGAMVGGDKKGVTTIDQVQADKEQAEIRYENLLEIMRKQIAEQNGEIQSLRAKVAMYEGHDSADAASDDDSIQFLRLTPTAYGKMVGKHRTTVVGWCREGKFPEFTKENENESIVTYFSLSAGKSIRHYLRVPHKGGQPLLEPEDTSNATSVVSNSEYKATSEKSSSFTETVRAMAAQRAVEAGMEYQQKHSKPITNLGESNDETG